MPEAPRTTINPADYSDKAYWHGYIDFYERFFIDRQFTNIAEFGVYKGKSIAWLLQRFPTAQIYGADILARQPEWPIDERFHFTQLDQASRSQIQAFLTQCPFDLIIEDGSHQPRHQVNCLVEGITALNPGGIYILEDVETSFSSHPWWNKQIRWWKYRQRSLQSLRKRDLQCGNALHALLAIDHYRKIAKPIDAKTAQLIANQSLLSVEEISHLDELIAEIHLYRRTRLPNFCYNCGSVDFDFSALKCLCGKDIFQVIESMSFVIIKRT